MIVFVLALLTFLLYIPNLYAFFQQDEWLAFSRLIILKHSEIGQVFLNIFTPTSGHYTPLNLFFILSEYLIFGINFKGYIVVSIILHIINVVLVFKLAKLITKDKLIAFFCAIIFGFLVTTFQATSWVIADSGTHLATIFTLLSLIFLFKFIEIKDKKYYIFSIILLTTSLFYKEISIANFVIFPFIVVVFLGKKINKNWLGLPIVLVCAFALFKLISMRLASGQDSGGLMFDKNNFLYNFFTIPMKSVVQSVIPYNFLLDLSKKVGGVVVKLFGVNFVSGTWQYDVFIENTVFEVVNIIIFVSICVFLLAYILRKWKKRTVKIIFVFCIFAFLNSFIFGLAPERSGRVSIIDSRNLYLLSVGTIFVFVLFLKQILNKKLYYLLIIFYLILNAGMVINQTQNLVEIGRERDDILRIVKSNYPDLPEKVVFFFSSDREYYGLGETVMPFQSGLGQTLLINYAETENYSHDFLRNQFLWSLKSQGYKEIDGKGFGYFTKEDQLMSNILEYRIEPQSVIGFSWENGVLINKTNEIREKIIKYIK